MDMIYKICDYIDIPSMNIYRNSKNFDEFFEKNNQLVYNFIQLNIKLKDKRK